MQGERMKLERVTVRGRRENEHWGTKGYKYPRSRTVTIIFQISEPPRKISELPNPEISADCSPYGRNLRDKTQNLRTRKQQGRNNNRSLSLRYGLGFKIDIL
jgi:hypothetical protein